MKGGQLAPDDVGQKAEGWNPGAGKDFSLEISFKSKLSSLI